MTHVHDPRPAPLFPVGTSGPVSLLACAAAFVSLALPGAALAAKFKTIEYAQGEQKFEGFVASPSKAAKGALPGILLIHNWKGVTDETRTQAARFADLGYVVMAADVYGKGLRPKDNAEAGKLAGQFKADRATYRERLNTALTELRKLPGVDTRHVAAIGYCFGGTGALELARSGADLTGIVSFHGGLDSPSPADGAKIKGHVLALHGADDPNVPAPDVDAFEKEMASNKVDWQLVKFGGTVHSFTEKAAGNDNSKGAAYNALSDARSFVLAKEFLATYLKK